MTVRYPLMVAVAAAVAVALALAYRALHRRRVRALAAAGFADTRSAVRRHVPPALFLAALTLLLLALARPEARISVPRATGTVILAFDVSNSMAATDAPPSRLAAAQAAAIGFVNAQPDSVDIGVVAFDQGAQVAGQPSNDHDQAIAAINRLHVAGGTSLGQAILVSLSTIVGRPVALPQPDAPPPDLGYWGSATIVVLSDGEDTGGPDALAAAGLAADAGVHVETIGVGTETGTTIAVDGYQVATALRPDLLTAIARAANGTYHPAGDAAALDAVYRSLDLRLTAKARLTELTGAAAGAAGLLLVAGSVLMIVWFGRIV